MLARNSTPYNTFLQQVQGRSTLFVPRTERANGHGQEDTVGRAIVGRQAGFVTLPPWQAANSSPKRATARALHSGSVYGAPWAPCGTRSVAFWR